MSKNARKILTVFSAVLFVLFLVAALPFIGQTASSVQEPIYTFAEEGPTPMAEATILDDPQDYSFEYNGQAWQVNANLYTVNRITDSKGQDVAENKAVNAGTYTVYVSPAENCVWKNGSGEKSFTLTISKATLSWYYPAETTKFNPQARHEISYSLNLSEQIDKVWASGAGKTYNFNRSKLVIVKDGTKPIEKSVREAGTYTFTAEDSYNYENPTFTLIIKRAKFELSGNNFYWTIGSPTSKIQLKNGDIHEYSYIKEGETMLKTAYTALKTDTPPYANWNDWTYVGTVNATRGMAAYQEGFKTKISLNGDGRTFTAEYGGVREAEESGKYEATAVITPDDNYELTYNPQPNSKPNMVIEDRHDGTFTVKKTWYVVHYINSFVSESSYETQKQEPYTFVSGWTFGQFPEGGIALPCLAHGDEIRMMKAKNIDMVQPGRYSLTVDGEPILVWDEALNHERYEGDGKQKWQSGEEDCVVFTLRQNGDVICRDEPRVRFNYYFNTYMPVGEYEITFRAKHISVGDHNHWWDKMQGSECGSDYSGVSISFGFTVGKATLLYDDSALNFYGKTDAAAFSVDIATTANGYGGFFGCTDGKIVYTNAITQSVVKESETFWAEESVTGTYFGAEPQLTYKLGRKADNEYYAEDASVWANLLNEPSTYYVCYKISLPNYESVPDISEIEKKYFYVDLYEVLELPELVEDKLQWNGETRTVSAKISDPRYEISENSQTEIGDYKAKFTITNPKIYHWKGVDGAVCEIPYSIIKATNRWSPTGRPYVSDWQWNSYDLKVNRIFAASVDGEPVFSISTDEGGLQLIEGLQSFTTNDQNEVTQEIADLINSTLKCGTYYLWGEVAETETHTAIGKTSHVFVVGLADNGWQTEPKINGWVSGTKPNLPTATPVYGKAEFKVVSELDRNDVFYDSANSVDRLSVISPGRYVLISYVSGTEDMYKGVEETEKHFLVYSVNTDENWVVMPSIASWKEGETPSEPQGIPAAPNSTVQFVYYNSDGELLSERPETAGKYKMVAIAYSADGVELARMEVDFKITKGLSTIMIVVICLLCVLACALTIIIIILIIRRKRSKGGDGEGGGDNADNGGSGGEPLPEEEQPEAVEQPTEAEQPAVEQPVEEQPVYEQSAEEEQSTEAEQPEAAEQPVAEEQPVVEEQPIVEEQPVVEQPEAVEQPTEEEQPAVEQPEEEQPEEAEEPEQPVESDADEGKKDEGQN